MEKYIITIVDEQGNVSLFTRDEHTVDKLIVDELDGWANLSATTTKGNKPKNSSEFCQAGTTKDGKLSFSIILIITK